jgi:hypothetical protein
VRRLGRITLRFTAILLAATAIAGAIRQLWSALRRERPAAAASSMRERAEIQRRAPAAPSPIASRAVIRGPRRTLGAADPGREHRAVREAATPGESHSDFEVSAEAGTRVADEVAGSERLEVRR